MQIPDAEALLRSHESVGEYVQVEGDRIFVREEGNRKGTPVLMLHGVPTSSFLWRQLTIQTGRFRTLAPDLPGMGLSSKRPDRDYSWSALAATASGLVDALKLPPFHLVVHDIGGPIGLEVAIRRPEKVKSITLLNSPIALANFKRPFPMNLFAGPLAGLAFGLIMTPSGMLRGFRGYLTRPSAIDKNDAHVYHTLLTRDGGQQTFLKIMRGFELTAAKETYLRDGLRKLSAEGVPAIVIWGTRDTALTAVHREAFVAAMPNAEVHLLDASHFLPEDHAEEIARLLVPFWEQVDGATALDDGSGVPGRDRVKNRPPMKGWRKMSSAGALEQRPRD